MIAIVSLLRPRDCRASEVRKCFQRLRSGAGRSWRRSRSGSGAPGWPAPALRSGTGCLSQRASGFFGGLPLQLRAGRRAAGVAGEGPAGLLRGLVRRPGWARRRGGRRRRRLEAEVGAVAVEVLALAGEVGQRVEELAVVGAAGAELVVDRLLAGREQDPGRAEAEPVELRQGDRLARLGGAGQAGGGFGEQPGDAAALLAGDQRAGLLEPRFRRRRSGRAARRPPARSSIA